MKVHATRLATGTAVALLILVSRPAALRAQNTAPPPPAAPEVRALLNQGKEAEKQSHNEAAARLYDQALRMARERKDRPGEATALAAQGQFLLFDAPAKAQECYTQALPIYQEIGDRSGEAGCQFYLGNCAWLLRQKEQALTSYDAALKLYSKTGGKLGQAMTLLRTGDVHRDTGLPAKALPYYEQALPLFQEIGDKAHQAMTLINLGKCHLELGNMARGRALMEQSLPLAREAGDRKNEALILHNLAGVYALEGDYRTAIERFQQALPLLEAVGTKGQVAGCLSNLSLLSFRVGDYMKSLEYADRALTLQKKAGNPRGIAQALDNLASDYSYLGQQDRALDLELQALHASEEGGDLRTKAQILNNLGRVYGKMERTSEEKTYVTQALDLYRQTGDKSGEAYALHFLATIRSKAGEQPQAVAAEEQSRTLFEALGDRHGVAITLEQSGGLAEDSGHNDEAQSYYKRALALFQEIDDVYGEANTLARIGELLESQGKLPEAGSFYEQALLRQEALRASLGGLADAKSRYQEETFPLYRNYIRILLETKQEARAFEWTQRAKARSLVDLMETSGVGAAGVPLTPEERERVEALRRRDKALSQQWLASLSDLSDLRRQAKPSRARQQQVERQAQAIRQAQLHLEQDWQAFQEQRYLRAPRLAAAGSAARSLTLDEAAFLPDDTALLEYAVLGSRKGSSARVELALFVVTQKDGKPQLRVLRQPATTALAQRVRELRDACAGRPDSPAERPYKDAARALYRQLIAPAEAALAGKRRLIVCPDGPLWDMPFQALLIPSPASLPRGATSPASVFLWERYALVYAYSATEMKAALDIRRRPNRPAPRDALLVLADPDFGPGPRVAMASPPAGSRVADPGGATDAGAAERTPLSLYAREGGLGALPYTRVEADAIRAAFPDAVLKTGGDAQEALVKQAAGSYRYLHFATHAVFNDAAPLLSGVVLARPPANSSEDGILTVRELFGLNLSADLLVLSACETARGANRPGEGLVGLTWAAFVAGVPTQVVSQWSVDDQATAALMGGFYRELKQGRAKDAALRNAALALMHDGHHAHPFYWAPFLVIGDWH